MFAASKRNKMLKQSTNQYRNIGGVLYNHYTSNPAEFKNCKLFCKVEGLKYRIIADQFYMEVRK